MRRGDGDFAKFCECLEQSNQGHIVTNYLQLGGWGGNVQSMCTYKLLLHFAIKALNTTVSLKPKY